MQNFTPPGSASWMVRTLELLALTARRLVRRERAVSPAFHWAKMRSIDFEGEDTSLTEDEIRLLR